MCKLIPFFNFFFQVFFHVAKSSDSLSKKKYDAFDNFFAYVDIVRKIYIEFDVLMTVSFVKGDKNGAQLEGVQHFLF